MSEDDFWGPLGSENKPKSTESVLKAQQAKKDALKAAKREKQKRFGLVGAGAGALVLMITAAIFINPFGSDFEDKTVKKEVVREANKQDRVEKEWYDKEENLIPADDIPDFQKEPGAGLTTPANEMPEEVSKYADQIWANSYGETVTKATLVNEEAGWTSDADKVYNKDGTLNVDFSFWTSDLFLKESTFQVSRILNPNFGGWGRYQFPEAQARTKFDPTVMDGVFSRNYIERLQKMKDKSSAPIFADWDSNNYNLGDKLLTQGQVDYRWVGEVTGEPEASFKWEPATLNYRATVTYPVTYTAWATNQTKFTKTGTLKLEFIADVAGGINQSAYRVVVDNGTLNLR